MARTSPMSLTVYRHIVVVLVVVMLCVAVSRFVHQPQSVNRRGKKTMTTNLCWQQTQSLSAKLNNVTVVGLFKI